MTDRRDMKYPACKDCNHYLPPEICSRPDIVWSPLHGEYRPEPRTTLKTIYSERPDKGITFYDECGVSGRYFTKGREE